MMMVVVASVVVVVASMVVVVTTFMTSLELISVLSGSRLRNLGGCFLRGSLEATMGTTMTVVVVVVGMVAVRTNFLD